MTAEQIAELLAQIVAVTDGLKEHVNKTCADMTAKYDSLADKIAKRDAAGEGPGRGQDDMGGGDDDMTRRGMATRVAADAVSRGEFRQMQEQLNELRVRDGMSLDRQSKSTRDAYADVQAKADAVMRIHGQSAEPPMSGEDIVAYQIRLARKMQPHSKRYAKADLQRIAADGIVFEQVLSQIRADAYEAGMNPVDLPEFQHRKIVQESPGGHKITSFVGNGTIFKQMSRPVRHVAFIGTRGTAHH